MEYKHCADENFEDLASGRVLYGAPGAPNFPVRLGNEIYRRCLNYCDLKSGVAVHDPCCGGGYLLTALGFCNPEISRLTGGDIDARMVELANKNLSLLTPEGLTARERELLALCEAHGKPSHRAALDSLKRLRALRNAPVACRALQADCFTPSKAAADADIILVDVPYGYLTAWRGEARDPLYALFDALAASAQGGVVLAVVADKKQAVKHAAWTRLEKQLIGKRKFEIFRRA